MNELAEKWHRLNEYLNMLQDFDAKDASFKIKAENGNGIFLLPLIRKENFIQDWCIISENTQSLRYIPDRGIWFFVINGLFEMNYRLGGKTYRRQLTEEQHIRIPPTVSFQLTTFDQNCTLLIFSLERSINGKSRQADAI